MFCRIQVFILFICVSVPLLAQSEGVVLHESSELVSFQLPDSFSYVSLGSYIQVLEDEDSEFEYDDIVGSHNQLSFKKPNAAVPSYGYTNSTYWFALNIENPSSRSRSLILEIAYPPLDDVQAFFTANTDRIEFQQAGDSISFIGRTVQHHAPAFAIEMAAFQSTRVLLRVQTSSSLQVPVNLWTSEAFDQKQNWEVLLWGVYFGALLVMFAYNLFLFFVVREKSYLYYVFYVSCVMAFQLAVNGLASQYLWPSATYITNHFLLISLNAVGIGAVLFSISFLELQRNAHYINSFLNFFLFGFISMIVLVFIAPYSIILKITILLFAGSIIGMLSGGFKCWRRGVDPARIYLVAWFVVLGGGLIYALKTLALLPSNVFTNYAVTIGSVLDLILLSFALGKRINIEKRSKMDAQRQAYQAQQELLQANERSITALQQSEKIKDAFLSSISHELRTPMNGIIGCGQLLAENQSDKEKRLILSKLDASSKEMMMLVDHVLDFTQYYGEGSKVENNPINVQSMIDQIVAFYQPRANKKGVVFELKLDKNLPSIIWSDQKKLSRIINDLVNNAVKFTQQGKVTLSISAQRLEAKNSEQTYKFCFSVADTGVGIEPGLQKQMFERFSRGEDEKNNQYGGLGLGLTLCRRCAKLLDGSLTIESTPGKGTLCQFSLSVILDSRTQVTKLPKLSTQVPANILIVEDNPTNQMITARFVRKLGHLPQIAANGEIALKVMDEQIFDLVLMDCQVPVMDGYLATQHIRDKQNGHCNIPVIAVTANAMEGDKEKCIEAGMNDYIAKPINIALLEIKINEWLSVTL